MVSSGNKPSLTRREFLKQGTTLAVAAAGVAALGAPAIVRGQNLGSQITVGVIGTGSRGCYMMRLLAGLPGVTVTDLCDVYPPHLQQGVEASGNPQVRRHEQWQKLLEQQDTDAILVSPPLFLHVPCSVAALGAGKHVYSEKSMGLNVKQLNEVSEAAKRNPKLVYLVGYQSRLGEAFLDAKRLVREGSFGKITQFYLHYDRNSSWRKELEDPKLERLLNWRMYREYCGGIITELLAHEIDMMMDLLGTSPVQGACAGQIMVYKDGREHHDSLMGYLQMEDGVLGTISGHLSNSRWGSGWAVHGTHGTLEFLGGGFQIFWERETRHLQTVGVEHKFNKIKLGQSLDVKDTPIQAADKVVDFRNSETADSSKQALEHFCSCIRNGDQPIMGYASARRTSMAALLLYESSLAGGRTMKMEEIEAMG